MTDQFCKNAGRTRGEKDCLSIAFDTVIIGIPTNPWSHGYHNLTSFRRPFGGDLVAFVKSTLLKSPQTAQLTIAADFSTMWTKVRNITPLRCQRLPSRAKIAGSQWETPGSRRGRGSESIGAQGASQRGGQGDAKPALAGKPPGGRILSFCARHCEAMYNIVLLSLGSHVALYTGGTTDMRAIES